MKFVINRIYGGYELSDWARKTLGIEWSEDINRNDPRLIELVEQDTKRASGKYAKLCIQEIPNEATDWKIMEYDGLEYVLYVLDGKIHYAK